VKVCARVFTTRITSCCTAHCHPSIL